MPRKPPRACRCGALVEAGQRCAVCVSSWSRPSAHWSGGSDRRWRRVRAAQLADHPLCQWPRCVRLADDVDHVTPLALGGERYDPDNLQSLCRDHHKVKSGADARRIREAGRHQ